MNAMPIPATDLVIYVTKIVGASIKTSVGQNEIVTIYPDADQFSGSLPSALLDTRSGRTSKKKWLSIPSIERRRTTRARSGATW